jgi:hypothetical protein
VKVLTKIFSISLLLIFLLSILGVQINKHYCGDFLAEVGVYFHPDSCSKMNLQDSCYAKKKSCCNDEEEIYQLDIDLIKQSQERQQIKWYSILLDSFIINTFEEGELQVPGIKEVYPPPLKIPLYKQYSRYTYYG